LWPTASKEYIPWMDLPFSRMDSHASLVQGTLNEYLPRWKSKELLMIASVEGSRVTAPDELELASEFESELASTTTSLRGATAVGRRIPTEALIASFMFAMTFGVARKHILEKFLD